jgi:hypothetical protein
VRRTHAVTLAVAASAAAAAAVRKIAEASMTVHSLYLWPYLGIDGGDDASVEGSGKSSTGGVCRANASPAPVIITAAQYCRYAAGAHFGRWHLDEVTGTPCLHTHWQYNIIVHTPLIVIGVCDNPFLTSQSMSHFTIHVSLHNPFLTSQPMSHFTIHVSQAMGMARMARTMSTRMPQLPVVLERVPIP